MSEELCPLCLGTGYATEEKLEQADAYNPNVLELRTLRVPCPRGCTPPLEPPDHEGDDDWTDDDSKVFNWEYGD